jgi:hypothetical protein
LSGGPIAVPGDGIADYCTDVSTSNIDVLKSILEDYLAQ